MTMFKIHLGPMVAEFPGVVRYIPLSHEEVESS
jgi:hypothetical protein